MGLTSLLFVLETFNVFVRQSWDREIQIFEATVINFESNGSSHGRRVCFLKKSALEAWDSPLHHTYDWMDFFEMSAEEGFQSLHPESWFEKLGVQGSNEMDALHRQVTLVEQWTIYIHSMVQISTICTAICSTYDHANRLYFNLVTLEQDLVHHLQHILT